MLITLVFFYFFYISKWDRFVSIISFARITLYIYTYFTILRYEREKKALNRRRTDNAMAKRRETKTMVHNYPALQIAPNSWYYPCQKSGDKSYSVVLYDERRRRRECDDNQRSVSLVIRDIYVVTVS